VNGTLEGLSQRVTQNPGVVYTNGKMRSLEEQDMKTKLELLLDSQSGVNASRVVQNHHRKVSL
jgi:hypothetical protein